MKQRILSLAILLLSVASLTITGCPDRSYQRPVPDYSNMSDAGSDEEDAIDEATASLKDE